MKVSSFKLICVGFITLFYLTGCSPWTVVNQITNDSWLDLEPGSTIGQTFVADYNGLEAIHLLLGPLEPGTGKVTVHIRAEPTSTADLSMGSIATESITESRYYRFEFPTLADSNGKYYFVFLDMEGDGSIQSAIGPREAYLNGSAYLNNSPIDSQMVFKLDYDRGVSYPSIFGEIISTTKYMVLGGLLLAIPGWVLLSLTWRGWCRQHFATKIAISAGTSIGIYIILVIYTSLLNVNLGPGYAILPLLAGIVILTWQNRYGIKRLLQKRKFTHGLHRENLTSQAAANITLFIVILVLMFARVWQMRNLEAPLWGDSVQHTAIVQLLIDHEGLFDSWLPYAQYKTFSMHFGFPLLAALFAWTSKMSSGQSVLFAGQLLNIFSAIVLYPLAVRLANGNRWAGVMAVLAAGLISPMPAFYVNWGRYAQLAGQVVLPVLIWMLWDVLDETFLASNTKWYQHLPWKKIIISGITLTGLVLCQFRMPYYLMAFLLAWAIGWSIKHWRTNLNSWMRGLVSLVIIGITGGILFIPWGFRIVDGNLISLESLGAAQPDLVRIVRLDYLQWKELFTYVTPVMLFLAILGLLLAFIKTDWLLVSIGLWTAFLASIYSLQLIDLPGAQFVTSFSVLIAIYMPVSLLFGYGFGRLGDYLDQVKYGHLLMGGIAIIAAFNGAWGQRNLTQPDQFAMVTRPDIKAMSWIRENTPRESKFLVEGFKAYWDTSAVGADAGWWIPIYTERGNTMPPQYALTDETPIEEGYSRKVIELITELDKSGINAPSSQRLICEMNVTHVYIGQKMGMVGNSGEALFTHEELEQNPNYKLEYHLDGVSIFSLDEAACGE